MIHGIGDASDYDTYPTTDWNKAASMGCRFGIIRATTTGAWVGGKPSLREDTRHVANAQGLANMGMDRYSYCWFDPRVSVDPIDQAQFYIDAVNKVGGPGKMAIIDVEPSGTIVYNAASIARLRAWCDIVSQKWPVAIYSYPTFISQMALVCDVSWMKDYGWMVAHWDVLVPKDPWPWYPGSHLIWQYTASMPGARYGFCGAPGKPAPKICMAVMEGK